MKKYIVKFKDREKVFGEFSSKEEASDKVMEYIHDHYISPFDFILEDVELSTADLIPDFESAKRYLNLKEPNEKNSQALVALNELFTIAEAWNKEDGFVPDFSNEGQYKYYPWFIYDKEEGRFVCADANNTTMCAHANFGSRLCFKSSARAAQFGKQFAHLYNKVFLNTDERNKLLTKLKYKGNGKERNEFF